MITLPPYSLRKKPRCPFGDLEWNDYYWVYPRETQTQTEYWDTVTDPDGKTRRLINEWKQQQEDVRYLVDFVHNLGSGTLLDVGCGPGFFLSQLNDKWDRYGFDISEHALEKASDFATCYSGDFCTLDLAPNSFDVILLHHVIEHLDDPLSYINKIKTLLKKDGIFIVATPDFDSAMARRFKLKYRMLHDPQHVSLFTQFSLVKLLEDYNFDVLSIDYPYFDTRFFTQESLLKTVDTKQVSPAFYGNHMTIIAKLNK